MYIKTAEDGLLNISGFHTGVMGSSPKENIRFVVVETEPDSAST